MIPSECIIFDRNRAHKESGPATQSPTSLHPPWLLERADTVNTSVIEPTPLHKAMANPVAIHSLVVVATVQISQLKIVVKKKTQQTKHGSILALVALSGAAFQRQTLVPNLAAPRIFYFVFASQFSSFLGG